MSVLEELFCEIHAIAIDCSMRAHMSGRNGVVVCVADDRTHVLLEIGLNKRGRISITKHRTDELTRKTQGREIDSLWVKGFLKHNKPYAQKCEAENKRRKSDVERAAAVEQQPPRSLAAPAYTMPNAAEMCACCGRRPINGRCRCSD